MKRIAVYARCSTADQHTEIQIHTLREYAAARGLEITEEYVDDAISGARTRRPALDRLLADARRRKFDGVAVVRLDRLGRSLHNLLTILGELEALGIEFIALEDGLDTSTPVGKLFFSIRGAFAEYERNLIAERTRDGLRAARRRGARIGRPRALRGDTYQLEALAQKGLSLRQIGERLGCSAPTVSRELKRLRATR